MSNNTTPLSREEVSAAVRMMNRVAELKLKSPIELTNSEKTELDTNEKFLSKLFLDHANEFLAVWFAVSDEYEPLINFIARITQRIAALRRQQQPTAPKVTE